MTGTLRSEWIKISTVLSHKILVIVAVAFPLLVGVLASTFGGMEGGPVDGAEMADFVFTMSVVATMLLGVVAVINLTSEYTHSTIRPTYAATPIRHKVLLAKLLVSSALSVAVIAFVAFGTFFVTGTIFNSRGGDVSIGDDQALVVLVSTVVLGLLVSWFGFGIGLVVRNSPASVSLLLLWPLLIENLLRGVFALTGWDGASKWLPYAAAIEASVADVNPDALGRPAGQIWFGVVAAVLVSVGIWLDNRRDA